MSTNDSQNASEFNSEQLTSANSSSAEFLRDVYATHQRNKNDQVSEKNRLLDSTINSHSWQPTLHRSKLDRDRRPKSSRGNLEKTPKEHGNHPVKEHARQSSDNSEESYGNCDEVDEGEDEEEDGGGKIVMASSLTRKSGEEETDDARGKDAIEKPLNHRRSFQPGRWGMSVSSPLTEFLRNVSRGATHRKNKEHTGGRQEDDKVHRTDRWDVSVSSLGKGFLEEMPKQLRLGEGHGTESSTVKIGSRLGQVKGSSSDRSPTPPRRPGLRIKLMTDERDNEEFASNALGKAASRPNRPASRWESEQRVHQANIDLRPFAILIREIMLSWPNIDFGPDSGTDIPAQMIPSFAR